MSKLKTEVTRIRVEGKKAKQGHEGRGALDQVTNLQSALDDAKGGHEQLRLAARNAEMQREAAARKEAELKTELSALQMKVKRVEEEAGTYKEQVRVLQCVRAYMWVPSASSWHQQLAKQDMYLRVQTAYAARGCQAVH